MTKGAKPDAFPRQLAVSMEPVYWMSLRRLRAKKGVGPGTLAKLALHEYLYKEDPGFREEQDREAASVTYESSIQYPEIAMRLNDAE
jgi:hypothetical protein